MLDDSNNKANVNYLSIANHLLGDYQARTFKPLNASFHRALFLNLCHATEEDFYYPIYSFFEHISGSQVILTRLCILVWRFQLPC